MATKKSAADASANSDTPAPTKIQLTCPFGFYDENNLLRMWQAGQEVTDPDEIALLLGLGAEHTVVE